MTAPQLASRLAVMPWSKVRLLLALVLLLAAVGRFYQLGRLEVWHDEACTVLTATSSAGVWEELRHDTNAPLYFLIMQRWTTYAGIDAFSLRVPSAVFGLATVAFLGFFVRRTGASWQTALWAMFLGALTPLQLRYSQEARGYTLVCLLEVIALWAYVRALETRRPRFWLIHGAALAAGMYTHNLMVPVAAGFWLAALLARIPRRAWVALFGTHLLVALAYLPGLYLMLGQVGGSGGTEWLRERWLEIPPVWAIPRSLEALGLSGVTAPSAQMVSVLWRGLLLLVVVAALVSAFWPVRRGAAVPPAGLREFSRHGPLLLVFTLWPLVFMFLYSLFKQPIYMVGRYDILAQPAYLALLGCGFSRLQRFLAQRRWRFLPAATPVAGVAILLTLIHSVYLIIPPDILRHPRHSARAALLHQYAAPHDLVVCLGLEYAATAYQAQYRDLPFNLISFPRDTMRHPGWISSEAVLRGQWPDQPAEAAAVFDQAGRGGVQHLWIILDENLFDRSTQSYGFPDPAGPKATMRTRLAALLVQTAAVRGWRPWAYPDGDIIAGKYGLLAFECGR